MEFLLKKRKKKMAYFKPKKKNPLQLPNIFVICVCVSMYMHMHSVYKSPPHPSSQILHSNKVIKGLNFPPNY